MPDIVVIGSINMDLVVRTARMPRPGETVPGHAFAAVPGGKGANQAAAAARLGARVEMVGRVGADPFGPTLMDSLQRQGVGAGHVQVDDRTSSGTALIIVDDRGENSIVVTPGANGQVSIEDLARARGDIAAARYLVMQLEIPLETVRAGAELAAELGVPVILNAAPAQPVDSALLRAVHCVIVNEHEAEALTGRAVPDLDAAHDAGRALLDRGARVAILTLGARGALLVTPDDALHVPARTVQVVDTTAAGDAFVGGLVAALVRREPLPDAVRYATCAGTLATMVLGAQTSLPSAEAVTRFLAGGQA